jgi:hypothetical protein
MFSITFLLFKINQIFSDYGVGDLETRDIVGPLIDSLG